MAYSTITKPKDHFDGKTYLGSSSAVTVTGLEFQPDLVWIKDRDNGNYHCLVDAVRGVGKYIQSDNTSVEINNASQSISAFTSDGFTTGTANPANESASTTKGFMSWNWKGTGAGSSNTNGSITSTVSANTTAGFSIVKYTGNGTNNATFGHGLGVAPKIMIGKCLGNTNSWQVTGNVSPLVENKYFTLDTSNAIANSTNVTFDASATTIKLQGGQGTNVSGQPHIAYCFAEKTGYSKFGSYVGNGSSDGPMVYTGFKPAFVMLKKSSDAGNWQMFDKKRVGYNPDNDVLRANLSNSECTSCVEIDILSNGFKLRNTDGDGNTSGGTYIYMSFAEEPLVANVGASIPATAR